MTTAGDIEGAIARVGAVSAALRSDDWLRASRLVEEFLEGAPDHVVAELRALDGQAERSVRPIYFELAVA